MSALLMGLFCQTHLIYLRIEAGCGSDMAILPIQNGSSYSLLIGMSFEVDNGKVVGLALMIQTSGVSQHHLRSRHMSFACPITINQVLLAYGLVIYCINVRFTFRV
jgi:hypothetical protein